LPEFLQTLIRFPNAFASNLTGIFEGGTRKCVPPLVIAASFVIGLIVRLAEIESANQVIEGRHVARHVGVGAWHRVG
jgi:hypothetical protein